MTHSHVLHGHKVHLRGPLELRLGGKDKMITPAVPIISP